MSFQEITKISSRVLVSAEQLPIFLLPDISGDLISILPLAWELQKRGNKRQIYVWHDPEPSPAGQSLASYAEKIRDEIAALLPIGPCFVGGFSFGGSVASVVAKKLAEIGREVALFIADTPSIECSQSFLQAGNPLATKELISIFHYAAVLAYQHMNQELPPLNLEPLENLSQQAIEEQISFLRQFFITRVEAHTDLYAELSQRLAAVSQNLLNLIQHRIKAAPLLLSRISIFLSQETQEKYSFYGLNVKKSWTNYCPEGEVTDLNPSTHFSLLQDPYHRSIVADKMITFFGTYLSPENSPFRTYLSPENSPEKLMSTILKSWLKMYPHLDLRRLLSEFENGEPSPRLHSLATPSKARLETFTIFTPHSSAEEATPMLLSSPRELGAELLPPPTRRSPTNFLALQEVSEEKILPFEALAAHSAFNNSSLVSSGKLAARLNEEMSDEVTPSQAKARRKEKDKGGPNFFASKNYGTRRQEKEQGACLLGSLPFPVKKTTSCKY